MFWLSLGFVENYYYYDGTKWSSLFWTFPCTDTLNWFKPALSCLPLLWYSVTIPHINNFIGKSTRTQWFTAFSANRLTFTIVLCRHSNPNNYFSIWSLLSSLWEAPDSAPCWWNMCRELLLHPITLSDDTWLIPVSGSFLRGNILFHTKTAKRLNSDWWYGFLTNNPLL